MTEPSADLVPFHTARTPFEARVIVAVLEDAGIPAYVAGGALTDEFALSQQLLNVQGVCVQVRRPDLAAATAALAAAKRTGAALDEDGGDGGDSGEGEGD